MFHEVDFLFQWYRWSFKCLASYFTLIFRSSCPVLPFTIYCCPSVRPLVPGHFRFNSITTRWRMRALISRAVTPAPPPPFPCSAQPSAKTASSWSRLVYYIYVTVTGTGRIAEVGPFWLVRLRNTVHQYRYQSWGTAIFSSVLKLVNNKWKVGVVKDHTSR